MYSCPKKTNNEKKVGLILIKTEGGRRNQMGTVVRFYLIIFIYKSTQIRRLIIHNFKSRVKYKNLQIESRKV